MWGIVFLFLSSFISSYIKDSLHKKECVTNYGIKICTIGS
jgi:hypothetical protein